MPQHTDAERKKNRQKTGIGIVDALAGKPVPGGVSSTAFQRVINVLRSITVGQDKKKKRANK